MGPVMEGEDEQLRQNLLLKALLEQLVMSQPNQPCKSCRRLGSEAQRASHALLLPESEDGPQVCVLSVCGTKRVRSQRF